MVLVAVGFSDVYIHYISKLVLCFCAVSWWDVSVFSAQVWTYKNNKNHFHRFIMILTLESLPWHLEDSKTQREINVCIYPLQLAVTQIFSSCTIHGWCGKTVCANMGHWDTIFKTNSTLQCTQRMQRVSCDKLKNFVLWALTAASSVAKTELKTKITAPLASSVNLSTNQSNVCILTPNATLVCNDLNRPPARKRP